MHVSHTLTNAGYAVHVNGKDVTRPDANYTIKVFHDDQVTLTVLPKKEARGIVRCFITQKHQHEINAYNLKTEKTLTFEVP